MARFIKKLLHHRCLMLDRIPNRSVQIWSYSWSVFYCIQFEYRKIRTRNNWAFGHICQMLITCFWLLLFQSSSFAIEEALRSHSVAIRKHSGPLNAGIFSNFKEPIQNIVSLDREFPFINSLKGSPVYRKMFQSHSQKSAILPFDKSTENVKNVSKKGKKKTLLDLLNSLPFI